MDFGSAASSYDSWGDTCAWGHLVNAMYNISKELWQSKAFRPQNGTMTVYKNELSSRPYVQRCSEHIFRMPSDYSSVFQRFISQVLNGIGHGHWIVLKHLNSGMEVIILPLNEAGANCHVNLSHVMFFTPHVEVLIRFQIWLSAVKYRGTIPSLAFLYSSVLVVQLS